MATTRRVEARPYGWLVYRSDDDVDPATVIPIDMDSREIWCCDCAKYECDHAVAVLHFLIDREGR